MPEIPTVDELTANDALVKQVAVDIPGFETQVAAIVKGKLDGLLAPFTSLAPGMPLTARRGFNPTAAGKPLGQLTVDTTLPFLHFDHVFWDHQTLYLNAKLRVRSDGDGQYEVPYWWFFE